MHGYLLEGGGVERPSEGWHDTGDVVEISDDGWITILGRVKRFAKIGGEMVSLAAAEDIASAVWPDSRHAVIAMPDGRKGEHLLLVTDRNDAAVSKLLEYAKTCGLPELSVPRRLLKVTDVPVLGTGKTDYVAIQRLAESEIKVA